MPIIRFKCENCGCGIIGEVMVDLTQITYIKGIDEEGLFIYGFSRTEGGKMCCYKCAKCGKVILDKEGEPITTMNELAEYMSNQGGTSNEAL